MENSEKTLYGPKACSMGFEEKNRRGACDSTEFCAQIWPQPLLTVSKNFKNPVTIQARMINLHLHHHTRNAAVLACHSRQFGIGRGLVAPGLAEGAERVGLPVAGDLGPFHTRLTHSPSSK
jgi:hypothetical protein